MEDEKRTLEMAARRTMGRGNLQDSFADSSRDWPALRITAGFFLGTKTIGMAALRRNMSPEGWQLDLC